MTLNKGMFTSNSSEWETPQALFDRLDEEFHFTLDVCATKENAKCKRYYNKLQDGLRQKWSGVCWMNPPYGRRVGHWCRKAYESSLEGAIVVCLLPARTDTKWFHDWIMHKAKEVRFLKGRLRFSKITESNNAAPFPSMIVVYTPRRK